MTIFNTKLFCMIFCSLIGAGCISIPMGSEEWPVDDVNLSLYEKEEIEVIKFDGCHLEVFYDGNNNQTAYCTLWADGQFRIKKADKYSVPKRISFGLLPGLLVPRRPVSSIHPFSGGEDFTSPAYYVVTFIQNTLASCFIFPLVDSMLLEPFSECRHDINESNFAKFSLVGFCKYWATNEAREVSTMQNEIVAKVQIDEFSVAFKNGKGYWSGFSPKRGDNNGVRIIDGGPPYILPRKIRVHILQIGKYRGNLSEFLKDFEGSTFELEY